jgi:hypothetical protein
METALPFGLVSWRRWLLVRAFMLRGNGSSGRRANGEPVRVRLNLGYMLVMPGGTAQTAN